MSLCSHTVQEEQINFHVGQMAVLLFTSFKLIETKVKAVNKTKKLDWKTTSVAVLWIKGELKYVLSTPNE